MSASAEMRLIQKVHTGLFSCVKCCVVAHVLIVHRRVNLFRARTRV